MAYVTNRFIDRHNNKHTAFLIFRYINTQFDIIIIFILDLLNRVKLHPSWDIRPEILTCTNSFVLLSEPLGQVCSNFTDKDLFSDYDPKLKKRFQSVACGSLGVTTYVFKMAQVLSFLYTSSTWPQQQLYLIKLHINEYWAISTNKVWMFFLD